MITILITVYHNSWKKHTVLLGYNKKFPNRMKSENYNERIKYSFLKKNDIIYLKRKKY